MSCDNVITVQDLEIDKKHSTFYREVITGKAGGTGADIDSATNAVTGQTQATLPKVLSNVGFSPAGFDFTTGGTLTERDKAIFYQPDGNWYSWGGTLPKVVPPASSPASAGGIADNAWNVSTSAFMYRDWEGFTAELLAQADMVDNGQPDEIGNSQRVDAMSKIFGRKFANVDEMLAYDKLEIGVKYCTGGTVWERISDASGNLSDFVAVTHVSAKDFGAALDGIADDTASIQACFDQSPAGSTIFIFGKAKLSCLLPEPGGLAGLVALFVRKSLKITGTVEFLVPGDGHGLQISADNVSIIGGGIMTFSGVGAPGTIGHHVRTFANSTTIDGCVFKNCSDAGIGTFGGTLNEYNARADDPTFNPWSLAISNFVARNNVFEGVMGDAAIELWNTENFTIENNDISNCKNHGIRLLPARNGKVINNKGRDFNDGDLSTASAFIYCMSGSIAGKNAAAPENITISGNSCINAFDGLWLGKGGRSINVVSNDIYTRRYPITFQNITGEPYLGDGGVDLTVAFKNFTIKDNILKTVGEKCITAINLGTSANLSSLLLDGQINNNVMAGYSSSAIDLQPVVNNTNIEKVAINGNAMAPANASSATSQGIILQRVKSCSASGNTFESSESDKNYVIFGDLGGNAFVAKQSYKVSRSSNRLATQSSGLVTNWVIAEPVYLITTGVLPAPLTQYTTYYITNVSNNQVGLAATEAQAIAGQIITLTDGGSGTHTLVRRSGQ